MSAVLSSDEILEQITALPYSEKAKLFHEASSNNRPDVVAKIMSVEDIKPGSLRASFYRAATHNRIEIGKLLIAKLETDVNWENEDNYGMTPLIRATTNKYGEFVQLLLTREDLNPNIVIQLKDHLGVLYPNTVLTTVFGYNSRAVIPLPNEQWKKDLLNDPRVDWDIHEQLIEQMVSVRKEQAVQSMALKQWSDEQDALEAKVAPVRAALGLPEPVDFV